MTRLALLLALGLASATAAAQGTIRGAVHDSTQSFGAALAGAEVFVLGGSLRAETDSAGAFVLRNVPFGSQTLVVTHPRLDELWLDGLEATVELSATTPTAQIEIATPSALTVQRATCSREPSANDALLMGSVGTIDGHRIEGATITIDWTEMRLRRGEVTRRPRSVTAVTNNIGNYYGCGVPRSLEARIDSSGWATVVSEMRVSARAPTGMSTGTLVMFPNEERIQHLNLVLGAADDSATATVRGRVVRANGESIRRGRVISASDSSLTADINDEGTFVLRRLPHRTEQLYVRAVGYIPTWIEVVAADSLLDLGDVVLEPIPQRLETLIVTAERITRNRREFEERRRVGLGTFLDDEEVASYPKLTPIILYMRVPRSELILGRLGGMDMFALRRITIMGPGVCIPRWYVDGYLQLGVTPTEQAFMLADAKRVEVYDAQFAPPKYIDFDGCGAVVIWTR